MLKKQKNKRVLAFLLALLMVTTTVLGLVTPAETAKAAGTVTPEQAIAVKNGDFSNGKKFWNCFEMIWDWVDAKASFIPTAEGMKVDIQNPGSVGWHVSLGQDVVLYPGNTYTLSFDITSSIARTAWTGIEYKHDTAWKLVDETLSLDANVKKSISETFTVEDSEFEGEFIIRLGRNEGETYGAHEVLISDVKVEVEGYRDNIVLIKGGSFDNGIGSFTTDVNSGGNASFDANGGKLKASIADQGQNAESVVLQQNNLDIKAGYDYEVTFAARGTAQRNIKVVVADSNNTYLNETAYIDEVTGTYKLNFTAQNNGKAALKFLLGNSGATVSNHDIYFDNIRLDVAGAKDALGIQENGHDIGLPTPPVISEEAVNNVVGRPVTLTFVNTGNFGESIKGVVVDGNPVPNGQFSVGNGSVTLAQNLFTEEKEYQIEIRANGYEAANAKQMMYTNTMWQLDWSDEFNGDSVDMSKWDYQEGDGSDYGVPGWGNDEQQYYTRDNLEMKDGKLIFKADNDGREGMPYTSSRLWTSGKFEKAYGRFEAKMKLPAGDGLWPAFWMIPADEEYGGWASSGELDIMEARGREIDRVEGTIHYGRGWPNNQASGGSYVFEDGEDVTGYHIYAVEWEPGEIRWYVDGNLFHTENNWSSIGADSATKYAYPAPFDKPFYLVMNLAVGGKYDAGILPEDHIFPVYMEVDYVRTYDLVGREPIPAVEPVVEPEPIPSDAKQPVDGNYVSDTNFSDVVMNPATLDAVKWNFSTGEAFGGAATFGKEKIDGTTFAKVNITKPGDAVHSVQLIQKVPVVKGRYYKLSFDAKATDDRSMTVKIGGDETRGWSVYAGGFESNLTTDVKKYSYTFQMLHDTDIGSRLEFNMGLNTNSVYIGNVVLEETENSYDEHGPKEPLKSGNQIYNGTFDQGRQDRMTFWTVEGANGSVDETARELKVTISNAGNNADAVTVAQKGMEYMKNDKYELTFDARAAAGRDITVKFADKSGNVYSSKTVAVTTSNDNYKASFTMDQASVNEGQIIFALGGNSSDVYLDNVVLKRVTYNNFDFTGIPMYPLLNGNFDAGMAGWSTYGAWAGVENGELRANATLGGNTWDKLISYDGITLAPGLEYTFAFDARATIDTTFDVTLENAYYQRVKEYANLKVSSEMKHYEYTFRVDSKQTLALKYLIGGAAYNYDFYLDNVVLEVKNAPLQKPAYLNVDSNVSVMGRDVELNYYGTADWAAADKTLYVNRQEVSADYLNFNNGKVTINSDAFADTGAMQVKIGADGFEDTNTVTLRILPLDGNLIQNGDFESGLVGWGNYFHNGCASVQVNDESMAQITVNWHEGGDWNAILLQEGIPMEANKTYELTFDASASVARPIKATMKDTNMSGTVNLTTDIEQYSIMFTPDSSMTAELQFLFGFIENEGVATPDGNHNIYVGNICLRESDGTPAPVYPKVSGVKNGETYKTAVTPSIRYNGEYDFTLSKKLNKTDNYEAVNYPELVQISEDGFYKLVVTSRADANVKTVVEFVIDTNIDMTKDYYIIKSRSNSKTMEVAGTKNGAALVQTNYDERLSQFFTMEEVAGGYTVFRSLTSGKVIEVANSSTENSASIQQSDYYGDKNQQWKVVYADQGYVKLVNRASGKVIDIPGASGAEGLALKQYEDNGSNAQQWDIVKMDIPASKEMPDISNIDSWKENMITYPKFGKLVPAGPIFLQWINTNSIGNVASYEIYINDEQKGSVPATNKPVMEYEIYSTAVEKHTVKIVAVLDNGTRVESDTNDFYVSKKGVGWGTLYRTQDMNPSWYYHWATDPAAGTDPELEFVPMIWGNWGSAWLNNPANKKYRTVLAFNEPDFEEQSNVSPDEAIAAWPEFMQTGLRLGSPASAIPAVWSTWFDEFMIKLNADPALDTDFIAIHCYLDSTDGHKFLEMVDMTWEKWGKPIWITEFGVAAWGEQNAFKFDKDDVYNDFMKVVLPGLDERPYVERYAWFPFDPNDPYGGASGIFDYDTGVLNELGLLYRSLGNPEGYELEPLPENPNPVDPTPENPDPEDPNPTDPTPENPDPETPDPTDPTPENPDPSEAVTIHVEAEDYATMEGVAIEGCTEGGSNVAYIDPDDWMEYTIDVPAAGTYQLKVRASSPYDDVNVLSIQKDGVTLGSVNIEQTGGWQNWTDFTGDSIVLPKGEQTIRLHITSGRYNLNWFELSSIEGEVTPPITTDPVNIRIEAEDYKEMEGVAAENCSDEGAGQNIGWIDAGDWMDYEVTIPYAGSYKIDYRVNGWSNNASIQLINADQTLTETNVFTENVWATVTSDAVTLPQGTITLRVKVEDGGFNFNWMEIKSV